MNLSTLRAAAAVAAAALALAASSAAQDAGRPPAAQVAASLQAKYDTIRDFSADFVHTYEGGVLRRKAVERGTVQVKKPGRMRWEYTSPEKKTFVSDGRQMYLHEVRANQVTVFTVPQDDRAATAVLFLAGKGNVTRDFAVTYGEGGGPDTYVLRLQPKTQEPDYDWLLLTVDRQTMHIRALTAADNQGGRSTFQFTNLRENVGVADRTFEFKIPRGADVIRADSTGR
jgi:outer membrane lipoprotein carrier protein